MKFLNLLIVAIAISVAGSANAGEFLPKYPEENRVELSKLRQLKRALSLDLKAKGLGQTCNISGRPGWLILGGENALLNLSYSSTLDQDWYVDEGAQPLIVVRSDKKNDWIIEYQITSNKEMTKVIGMKRIEYYVLSRVYNAGTLLEPKIKKGIIAVKDFEGLCYRELPE